MHHVERDSLFFLSFGFVYLIVLFMYRFRKDGISVIAVVDRRRKKNNGLFPVKIEVIYKRTQKYYPTGKDVTSEEWESQPKARRLSDKFASIERSFHLVCNEVERLADKGEFSFSMLDARLGNASMTVNEALEAKMKTCLARGHVNSFYRCRSALHAIERFGGRRIMFTEITPQWLSRCERFWYDEGKGTTTVNIYMKTLRSVMKAALDAGILRDADFPFGGGYRIPPSRNRRMALDKKVISLIADWKGDAETEYWRDLWLFSYLCNGINFCDMLFLRRKDIIDGEVTFVRSKTSETAGSLRVIHAAMTPKMCEIIERRGNGLKGRPDGLLFRHAKGNEGPVEAALLVRKVIARCNICLHRIADELGIPRFTTYSARHSFATVLMKSGTDISYISESLGHASLSMTRHYLAGYGKDERRIYAGLLLDA